MNDLLELMAKRRTTRKFLPDKIDDGSLARILDAATLPPTGADLLPFSVIVVSGDEGKMRIRERCEEAEREYHDRLHGDLKERFRKMGLGWKKEFLTTAPVLLVVSGDTAKPYWRESTWLAVAYMLLAIENEGLGTVTYTPSEMGFLRDILEIPEELHPEVILPVGIPAEKKGAKHARRSGRVFFGKYGK